MYKTTLRLLLASTVLAISCHKINFNPNDLRNFEQIDLVANRSGYGAPLIDTTLKNGWGLAWSPTGIAWVNAEADGVSELYTGAGAIVRPPILIPSPTDTMGGGPTGIVFNSTKGFKLSNGSPASFIFVGDDGVVSAWNGALGGKAMRIANNSAGSSYTGLTLAWDGTRNLLYAADEMAGKIVVWDTTWASVSLSFKDPNLPAGYAPFNIANVGGMLFVTYAKLNSSGDETKAVGLGIVDVYTPGGDLVRRFASHGTLDAPWGVAWAPAGWLTTLDMGTSDSKGSSNGNGGGFGKHAVGPVVLIGNFGDGKINVFEPTGQFLGQLQAHNRTIAIDGLWSIGFAPSTATTIDPSRLYFTAGPHDEMDGIFGFIAKE